MLHALYRAQTYLFQICKSGVRIAFNFLGCFLPGKAILRMRVGPSRPVFP